MALNGQPSRLTALLVVGQGAGCGIVVLIVGALALGLWLDGLFASKPLFTLTCLGGSIPIALFILWQIGRFVRRVAQSILPVPQKEDGA